MNKKISIQWLLDGNPLTPQQASISNVASIRMRAALSMQLDIAGISVNVSPNLIINKDTNIIGVGKISLVNDSNKGEKWLNLIKHYKSKGAIIFIDYTDNHLRDSNKGSSLYDSYFKILSESDYVVTSSLYLERSIKSKFNIKTFVIEDPLEIEILPVKNILQESPTGLWFGHASNLNFLFSFLQNYNPKSKIRIIVMSNLDRIPPELIRTLEESISPLIDLVYTSWSIDNMKIAASLSDFCIIPCDIKDERKAGVSSNRLITALALGLPCFADNAESYIEFSDFYTPLSPNFTELFYINPDLFLKKTIHSQSMLLDKFSKQKIMGSWHKFFLNLF